MAAQDKLYDSPEKVLERARQVHVLEIVNEPRVREYVRRRIDQHMSTSTSAAHFITSLSAFLKFLIQ